MQIWFRLDIRIIFPYINIMTEFKLRFAQLDLELFQVLNLIVDYLRC